MNYIMGLTYYFDFKNMESVNRCCREYPNDTYIHTLIQYVNNNTFRLYISKELYQNSLMKKLYSCGHGIKWHKRHCINKLKCKGFTCNA